VDEKPVFRANPVYNTGTAGFWMNENGKKGGGVYGLGEREGWLKLVQTGVASPVRGRYDKWYNERKGGRRVTWGKGNEDGVIKNKEP